MTCSGELKYIVSLCLTVLRSSDVDITVRRASVPGNVPATSLGLWPAQPSSKRSPVVTVHAANNREFNKANSSTKIPLLENCVIPTLHVDIAQR